MRRNARSWRLRLEGVTREVATAVEAAVSTVAAAAATMPAVARCRCFKRQLSRALRRLGVPSHGEVEGAIHRGQESPEDGDCSLERRSSGHPTPQVFHDNKSILLDITHHADRPVKYRSRIEEALTVMDQSAAANSTSI